MKRSKGAAASVVVLAVLTVLVFVLLLRDPDPPSEGLASPVAGDEVPAVVEEPLVRMAVAGDTGTGDAAQLATAAEMVDQSVGGPAYDALVLLGDLVYENGEADLVDEVVTEPFAPLLENGTNVVPVLGNHDYHSGEQDQILAALGHSEPWYADQFGPARVVALDTERIDDEEQTRWLEATLAAPQPPGTWTVVAMHEPAYSAGYHGSDPDVQRLWVPLFEEYGVPLVLAGHDHDYQRSKLIDGVTYVVSGAGAKLRPAGQEDFTAVSTSTLHYLDLLFYDDRLAVRAIDHSGALVDSFTLQAQA